MRNYDGHRATRKHDTSDTECDSAGISIREHRIVSKAGRYPKVHYNLVFLGIDLIA